MDLNSISVHKHARKKKLGKYPAVLTGQAWLITHIYSVGSLAYKLIFFSWSRYITEVSTHNSLKQLRTHPINLVVVVVVVCFDVTLLSSQFHKFIYTLHKLFENYLQE